MSKIASMQAMQDLLNIPVIPLTPFEKGKQRFEFFVDIGGLTALGVAGLACISVISLPPIWVIVIAVVTFLAFATLLIRIGHFIDKAQAPAAKRREQAEGIAKVDLYAYNAWEYEKKTLKEVKAQVDRDLGERSKESSVRIDKEEVKCGKNFCKRLEYVLKSTIPDLMKDEKKYKAFLANLLLTSFRTMDVKVREEFEKEGVTVKESVGAAQNTQVSLDPENKSLDITKTVYFSIEKPGKKPDKKKVLLSYSLNPRVEKKWSFDSVVAQSDGWSAD